MAADNLLGVEEGRRKKSQMGKRQSSDSKRQHLIYNKVINS